MEKRETDKHTDLGLLSVQRLLALANPPSPCLSASE